MKGRAPHLRPKSLYPHFHFHWVGLCPEKLANKGRREEGEPFEGKKLHCVVPKIIHTSTMEAIFYWTPHLFGNSSQASYIYLKFLGL